MPRKNDLNPSRKELVGGLTVLSILAAVAISRPSGPARSHAEHDPVQPVTIARAVSPLANQQPQAGQPSTDRDDDWSMIAGDR